MAKNRVHTVTAKKGKDMSITIGKDFLLNAERRARREAAIATGTYMKSGAGRHGGTDRQLNRRERQGWRQKLRNGGDD